MQNTLAETALHSTPDSSVTDYERIMGAWLGKAVGGTLGMPFEGRDGPFYVEYYTPVPTEMIPNDDLDLIVVWACVLDGMEEVRVDRHVLAQAWLDHVGFPMDEYGMAIRNLNNGIQPPLSGSYDNWFIDGGGAAIRSELWACLAPGNPELAVAYAYEDGCVDHAEEGIWAEMFYTAIQSAAFVESDIATLLGTALGLIPEKSRIHQAVVDTKAWWDQTQDWKEVRELILQHHGHENCTDVAMNAAFVVLAWLASEGDFSRAICIAVNCGKDTDTTAATVGAIIGIINPRGISSHWLQPIGDILVLSPEIKNIDPPKSLGELTELVLSLRERLDERAPEGTTDPQSTEHLKIAAQMAFAHEMLDAEQAPELISPVGVTFPGTVGKLRHEEFRDDVLLLHYEFQIERAGKVRVMFNPREECRVWVDGRHAFDRPEGPMGPSHHRGWENHYADMELTRGKHELVAALRLRQGVDAEWVAGVADAATFQWHHQAFHGPHLF